MISSRRLLTLTVAIVVCGLLVSGLVACTVEPQPSNPPSLVAVPTLEPEPSGSPRACPAALIRGTLVAHPEWGLAITDTEGMTRKVMWPFGSAARLEGGRLVLLDASGSVLAREGDQIEIGGGESGNNRVGPDGTWIGCGGVKVVEGS